MKVPYLLDRPPRQSQLDLFSLTGMRANRIRYPLVSLKTDVTSAESRAGEEEMLVSRGYRITVDDGRDSFFAICIEEPDSETAWIMSDTVRSLEDML